MFDERHKKRYYRYRDGIDSIYNRELTAEEIERLHEVRSLLQGLRGMMEMDWLDQMTARFDQRAMGANQTIASFEDGTAGDAKFFLSLFDAIAHKQTMNIDYRRFGLDPKQRTIFPYYLKQYRRRWYLFATIVDHEFITCFSLDRILSCSKNDSVPFVESGVDFNHYFDDIVGVSHPDNGQVEHIVLKGDRWVEYYLSTLPIHPLQQLESLGEEGCRVTLDVMFNNELIQELAFYGDHLCVESPMSLREMMVGVEFLQDLRDKFIRLVGEHRSRDTAFGKSFKQRRAARIGGGVVVAVQLVLRVKDRLDLREALVGIAVCHSAADKHIPAVADEFIVF